MRNLYFLVLAALVLEACGAKAGDTRRGGPQRTSVTIRTAATQRISVQRQIDLSGTLLSLSQAKISSEVAGVIRDIPVELGTEVRAGDPLVRLEPRELALALDRAESALRQVEAQLGIQRAQDAPPPPDEQVASVRQALANRDDARSAFERSQQLSNRGLVSQVDRDTAETRLKVAEANYQAALDSVRALKATLQDRRAAYELAQKKLNDAVIKAPIAGSVAERLVQRGEFIRENTPVVTIVQMHPLKLRTAVQERYAGLVNPGQPVDFVVEAFPGQKFAGKIAYVSPAVDQTTRTFAVEALVNNEDHRLKPGFFAKGTVATKRDQNVLAVSDDAVSTMAGVSSVYVVEEGKIRQQTVTIGVHQDGVYEILDGLKGTETIATSNLSQLATGVPVAAEGEGRGGRGGRGGRRGGNGEGEQP